MNEFIFPNIGYIIFRKCTPNWRMEKQIISCPDITYVTEGMAEYAINGTTYRVGSGDLLCLPANSTREAISFPGDFMGCYSVDFRLSNAFGGLVELPFPLIINIGLQSDILKLFNDLWSTWLRRQPGYSIKAHGIFLLILDRLFDLMVYKTNSNRIDPRVKKVMNYIVEHYSEKLGVAELAELVNLNPVYFGALFKQYVGVTVKRYITEIRINHAVDMLKSGEYSISGLSESCGYNDDLYFSKQFKAIKGLSPSQYFNE